MMCAWKELLAILPPGIKKDVDQLGRGQLQALRLRVNAPAELVLGKGSVFLSGKVSREEISYVINGASRYSPWRASTAASGYITAPGGHRIGICGEAVCQMGQVTGIGRPDSLCIRVARDLPGIAEDGKQWEGSILILGPPGWGKTTLLRDLSRQKARSHQVSVIDPRGELFPDGFARGERMDVLRLCPVPAGIDMALRCMGPEYLAVDEITGQADCEALIRSANCGVFLLATAHGWDVEDLFARKIYRPLAQQGIFQTVVVLHRDKSFTVERMNR